MPLPGKIAVVTKKNHVQQFTDCSGVTLLVSMDVPSTDTTLNGGRISQVTDTLEQVFELS